MKKHEFIIVDTVPDCDFKDGKPAVIDGVTRYGPWAHMCEDHRRELYPHGDAVGLGMGQFLIPTDDLPRE